ARALSLRSAACSAVLRSRSFQKPRAESLRAWRRSLRGQTKRIFRPGIVRKRPLGLNMTLNAWDCTGFGQFGSVCYRPMLAFFPPAPLASAAIAAIIPGSLSHSPLGIERAVMHRFTLCLLLAGASFGFLQAEEGASQQSAVADKTEIGQWPRWRGPRADGISHETGWSTDWPEGGPRQLWTKSVGMGFSCTSVAGGKLYTVGHAGEIDTLYCLNAESGDEIWKVSYSAPIAKD